MGYFRPVKKFCIAAAFMLLAVWLICGAQQVFAGIIQVVPEAKSFKFGALELSVLRDSVLAFSNYGSVFGLNANQAAVAKVLGEAGATWTHC
jgi:hypothetical protein